MKTLVLLAQGFEEIEAVTIIDVLRRANIDVTTATIDNNPVIGSHDISISADILFKNANSNDFGMIILPGGMPGSSNLKDDSDVIELLKKINNNDGYLAAICAAPIVLGQADVMKDKNFTCYPGFETQIKKATYSPEPVIVDKKIITGKGPACAIPFALKIVEIIKGKDIADNIKQGMQVYWY